MGRTFNFIKIRLICREQEYDKVMIKMDKNFRYDKERRTQGKEHPNPDLLFYKLFYQAISRARENCVYWWWETTNYFPIV
ncbi:MAG: hypothetical protein LIP16_03950 [Clostridium sp.]|nr:hypothetical protein [Clostridium sp.]